MTASWKGEPPMGFYFREAAERAGEEPTYWQHVGKNQWVKAWFLENL